jgi:hypothetical protein
MARIKRVFISSTVYDLKPERQLVRTLLEEYSAQSPDYKLELLVSDDPDFPISPTDRTDKHSYDICIDNVARADYFILLLKQRYGDAIIRDGEEAISITHKEYRVARKRRIPRFILLDQKTWDAKQANNQGVKQDFVKGKHKKLFDFIDEIRKRPKGNWIDIYSDFNSIRAIINTFLTKYDDTSFVGDITIPEGRIVPVNEKFEKIWEIENTGLTVWENRFLREENTGASNLVAEKTIIPIPITRPGQRVQLSVNFIAPEYPATCESYWKMVDENGTYCFPHHHGLVCRVKVH